MAKVTWFGQATVRIETHGTTLLVDPFFEGNPVCAIRSEEVEADCVLITHGHPDHLGDTITIATRTGATVISNYEVQNWLASRGLDRLHALHIGGGYDFEWGRVKLTIAQHGSALPDGSYGGGPCGFLLYIEGKKIYHAGDTGLFYDMKLIGEEGIELALLPHRR